MPPALSHRPFSPDAMKLSPFLNFDDSPSFSESDQMIFGPLDLEDVNGLHHSPMPYHWDSFDVDSNDVKPPLSFSALSSLQTQDYAHAQLSPTASFYDSVGLPYTSEDLANSPSCDTTSYLASWLNDPEIAASSPINIPSSLDTHQQTSFIPFSDHPHFPTDGTFSPMSPSNMSLDSHARSISPSPPFEDPHPTRHRVLSVNPTATSVHTPAWATQLWDSSSSLRSPTSSRPSVRHSPFTETTLRSRMPMRRGSISSGQMFQSSSAPALSEPRAPSMTRSYSRRAESISTNDDRDATLRRRRRPEESPTPEKGSDIPLKSVLKPPKLAPSAWQLYFTDWIQRQQASGTRKLNVAQAAKEAGQEYASLSPEEKEPYKRRSLAAKEARERELNAYMRTLTPEDIKRENAYRAAQRKAGKSRKSNIKDPNAPKKPLSAYFMFLQRIRANPKLVHDIFGDETETTKQSVLAAAKWRSMTDAERQPFLAQAEQEKMEYEAARRIYEEGAPAYGTSINFSILPNSPAFTTIKMESSESESEGFSTDDGDRSTRR
ncbi:transcriptional regulator family: HMG [Agaricus bisporus var. burnettii]|uniref:Transcriptional regulator family: HMG n=1 Tax=Agaricus bisporus var. burnettii TaxID=192524 RepID=A0A8H7KH05_AGABI|nr:transcriptional regulator family: HMG [Agaricus bisporus var. burnettii]